MCTLMFSAVCCLWFLLSSSAFQVLVLLFRLSVFVFLFLSSAYSFPPCFKGFAVLRASESAVNFSVAPYRGRCGFTRIQTVKKKLSGREQSGIYRDYIINLKQSSSFSLYLDCRNPRISSNSYLLSWNSLITSGYPKYQSTIVVKKLSP